MKITDYIQDHIAWSKKTFGSGRHTLGLIKHIQKELDEIKEFPSDVEEWADVIILGIDGAWRAGYTAQQVAEALIEKQEVNRKREWGPVVSEDEPIEHVRSLGGILGEK
jgi:hypothetical protein